MKAPTRNTKQKRSVTPGLPTMMTDGNPQLIADSLAMQKLDEAAAALEERKEVAEQAAVVRAAAANVVKTPENGSPKSTGQ